jgi:hypothetical protein
MNEEQEESMVEVGASFLRTLSGALAIASILVLEGIIAGVFLHYMATAIFVAILAIELQV